MRCIAMVVSGEEKMGSGAQALEGQEIEARLHAELWTADSVLRSLDLYRDAASQWEGRGNLARSARCLREVARLEIMMANLDRAQRELERARGLDLKTKNIPGLAEDLSLFSSVSLKRGDLKSAQSHDELALAYAHLSGDLNALAHVFFSSAAISYASRDFAAMKRKLETAFDYFSQNGDVAGQIESYIELAYARIIDNDRVGGKDSALKAIDLATQINSRRGRVLGLIVLGDAHERMGEWAIAFSIFREAESLFPDELNVYERGILFNRLAHYYLSYREPEMALKYFEKSFACYDRSNDDEGRAEVLTDLGQLYSQHGDEGRATIAFNRSKEIALRTKDPLSLAVLNLKIGDTYFKKGEFSKAREYYEGSFSDFEKLGVEYRLAEIEEKFGRIFEHEEDYERARHLYSESLKRNRRIRSRLGEAESLFRLSGIEKISGNLDSSLDFIRQSINLTDLSLNETVNSRLEISLRDSVYERYELYISLLMRQWQRKSRDGSDRRAVQASEHVRGRVMFDNIQLSDAKFYEDAAALIATEKEITGLLNEKRDKLTDLLSASASTAEIRVIEDEAHGVENQLEEIRATIKRTSPMYSAIKDPSPFDIEDFQRNVLDDRSVLLEFSLGKEESYLWVVGKADFAAYVLPGRDEIEGRVEGLRGLLAARQMAQGESIDEHQRRVLKAEEKYWPAARALSGMILGQAAEKIKGKRLIVVPDGKLHYFPLSALPLPDAGNDEPMVLTNEVVYQPSAQTLSLLTKMSRKESSDRRDLLIFSDPVFTADDARLSGIEVATAKADDAPVDSFRFVESLNSLSRLPGSGTEADAIKDIVGGSATDAFSGFAATREQLLNTKVSDYKILHFATHGVVNNERPELSGIVMSRYGESGQQLNEFIRLQDIYGMKLNADLVVLSACETGVGKEVRGEGIMSLNNAFLQSGARTVLASLWKVEDGASQILMKEFYTGISSGGLTPSEALRQAQMKLARDPRYSSPFYWAAFTLQGDLNVRPEIANGMPPWAYALAVVPFLLLGVFLLRKKRVQSNPS